MFGPAERKEIAERFSTTTTNCTNLTNEEEDKMHKKKRKVLKNGIKFA